MSNLIVIGLQHLAKLLDRLIPLQGGRTILIAVLTIVGNITFFLTGSLTPEQVSNNILVAFGLIYASLHKSTT